MSAEKVPIVSSLLTAAGPSGRRQKKGRKAMTIKRIKSYSIGCTGDAVAGDEILFSESVFGGSYRRPVHIGERRIAAKIVKESYGAGKQQHTVSLVVIGADGVDAPKSGAKMRRKARNIYRNGTRRRPWEDESARDAAADEKHRRGDAARMVRDMRRELEPPRF